MSELVELDTGGAVLAAHGAPRPAPLVARGAVASRRGVAVTGTLAWSGYPAWQACAGTPAASSSAGTVAARLRIAVPFSDPGHDVRGVQRMQFIMRQPAAM
jgi:hypothetical protein